MRRGSSKLMFRGDTAPTFAPSDIANLAIWFDASDASTLTLDGSNNVEQWRDKSGNARHANQADSGRRPTFLSSGINGLPAVRGDGIDDIMTWTAFPSGTSHNFYVVAAFDTGLNQYRQFAGFIGSAAGFPAGHQMFCLDNSANPGVDSRQDGYSPDFRYIPASGATNIRSGGAAVHSFYRNAGNYGAKWTHGTLLTWSRTGNAATQSTATSRIFANYFGSTSFRIAELLCYSRDLTAGEEAQLSAYFTARYGVGI